MLSPKKVKFRKQMKGRRRGVAWRGSSLTFGEYGLQATGNGWVNAKEIEAAYGKDLTTKAPRMAPGDKRPEGMAYFFEMIRSTPLKRKVWLLWFGIAPATMPLFPPCGTSEILCLAASFITAATSCVLAGESRAGDDPVKRPRQSVSQGEMTSFSSE